MGEGEGGRQPAMDKFVGARIARLYLIILIMAMLVIMVIITIVAIIILLILASGFAMRILIKVILSWISIIIANNTIGSKLRMVKEM
jgi:hypothetical protein